MSEDKKEEAPTKELITGWKCPACKTRDPLNTQNKCALCGRKTK